MARVKPEYGPLLDVNTKKFQQPGPTPGEPGTPHPEPMPQPPKPDVETPYPAPHPPTEVPPPAPMGRAGGARAKRRAQRDG
jgi:hypothetical protein